jgi:hypothetical protein
MAAPPLTVRDVLALLARIGDAAERAVLVGGQAVNVWSELYLSQGRADELIPDAPFVSKDVDFCATRATVQIFAARLPSGSARFATLDDATPQLGLVQFTDDAGHLRQLDFLNAPFGMESKAITRASVPLDVLDEQGRPTGHRFRVMHPVHCLESRVHNVVGLADAYDTAHGRRQLRAAVVCAREAMRDILDTPGSDEFDPVRAVLDLNERLFHLCIRDRHGRVVHAQTGIDPLEAVLADPRLGDRFLTVRLPQEKRRVAALRSMVEARRQAAAAARTPRHG